MKKRQILIIKTGALGDVVRTTPLLRALRGDIHWLTSRAAAPLLPKSALAGLYVWESGAARKRLAGHSFDLVLNLEESPEICAYANGLRARHRAGIFLDDEKRVDYFKTPGRGWFDMGLVSRLKDPDARNLRNRKTYQEFLFQMVGRTFAGEEYLIAGGTDIAGGTHPRQKATGKSAPIVIGVEERSGAVWPMKQWHDYRRIGERLSKEGYTVVFLGQHRRLADYVREIATCDLVICGDTLAMHLALALRKQVVALFICTSPWEIHGYGRMQRVVSPSLEVAFYKRTYVGRYVRALGISAVYAAVGRALARVRRPARAAR